MKIGIAGVLVLFCLQVFAQDSTYTRKILNSLTAPALWGRGYTKEGMAKAAELIEREFKKLNLTPLHSSSYKQRFSFPVNTFPKTLRLNINGENLIPGRDFIVNPTSISQKIMGQLTQKDSLTWETNSGKSRVSFRDKLTWSVATKTVDYTEFIVKKGVVLGVPVSIDAKVDQVFVPNFVAYNVGAMIWGTRRPDSMIVFTAHYDHLGGMGKKTYFPGANDNASGVSFLLSLAKHYAKNPPPYTMVFICFAAEEAGLIGSKYFTENPLINLANIRFLINLDLVGTGENGATVVNATVFPEEFALLNRINDQGKYLVKINPRGKAANSDHYFFSEKGVPSFFLYTQGGITAYHDIDDKAETLPFTVYKNLFNLFLFFNRSLMGTQ